MLKFALLGARPLPMAINNVGIGLAFIFQELAHWYCGMIGPLSPTPFRKARVKRPFWREVGEDMMNIPHSSFMFSGDIIFLIREPMRHIRNR
ncbi:MAG: hypothetical protein L0154_27580 [Chloroflexi bacterium]|nr:hypothetical protein [Chloroflexota bacterium]